MAVKFTSITIFFKIPMYKYVIFIREYNCVHINIINISTRVSRYTCTWISARDGVLCII